MIFYTHVVGPIKIRFVICFKLFISSIYLTFVTYEKYVKLILLNVLQTLKVYSII